VPGTLVRGECSARLLGNDELRTLLTTVAASLLAAKLEAVPLENAAAAIQGAPVTTLVLELIRRRLALPVEKGLNFLRVRRPVVVRIFEAR